MNNENCDCDKKQIVDSDEINQQKSDIHLFQSLNSHLEGPMHLCSSEGTIKEETTGRTVNDNDQACTYKVAPVNDASTSDQLSETVHMELPVVLGTNIEISSHQLEKVVSSQQNDGSCLKKDHAEERHTSADDQLIAKGLGEKCVPSSCTIDEKVSQGEDEDDDQLIAEGLGEKCVPSSRTMYEKASQSEDDRGMSCSSVFMQMDDVVADTIESSKIVVSLEKLNVQDQDLPPAQATTTETEEVSRQVDAAIPESLSDHKEDSTVVLPDLRNENDTICMPTITDDHILVPSFSKPAIHDVVNDDHKAVDNLEESVVHPAQLEIEDHAEVEISKMDLRAQLSDPHVAVEHGSWSEPAQDFVAEKHASNEQSVGMAISESTSALKNGSPIGICESKTAEAIISLECVNALEVAENLVDVAGKVESCDEATVTLEKSRVSTAQEKCETESSVGNVSKAVESTLVLTGSLPVSRQILDVTEDGRDHCDVDDTILGTQIVDENGSISVSEKEIGKSEIFTVQDVGVSGAVAQDGKDEPHVLCPKEINASKAEKSSALQFMEACSASGSVLAGSEIQHIVNQVKHQIDNKENISSKATPDRKSRRPSTKSAGRESTKKGDLGKDAHPVKQSEQPGKSSDVPLVPSGIFQLQQNDMLHSRQKEGHGISPIGSTLSTFASSLPDLNSSAFPLMVFQQPFNDQQQVQLRAQILVYGSLISRLVPEELHMLSAFGGSDDGRSMWEKAWQTCKARVSSQTPDLVCSDTPTSYQSDMVSDSLSKQFKVCPSPYGQSSTIGTPTVGINPMVPLSSPLWSLPTPSLDVMQSKVMVRSAVVDYQTVIPQQAPNQIQPIISYVGHGTTWMSQTPLRSPWGACPQTPAINTSIHFPSFSMEPVQLTPVMEPSLALCSGMKHAPPDPSTQIGVHDGATTVASPSLDLAKVIVQPDKPSSNPKSKKRKKGLPYEDLSRSTMGSQSHSGKSSVPASGSCLKASVAATAPDCFPSKFSTLEFDALASLTPTIFPVKEADPVKKKIVLSEEVNEVKKAKQQADNAAAAVCHSQEVWDDLDKKRISGSISVLEAQLSFAAVSVSAATAVAKAAAMAASLASNAALKAKAMADEALTDGCCCNSSTVLDSLKGDRGRNASSSIILAVKEASRRRVEAASAAALRAENLDMIVQAAELAEKAIFEAAKVVTIGDSSSLGKLAEACPEGFWELVQSSFDFSSRLQDANPVQGGNENVIAGSYGSEKILEGSPDDGEAFLNQNIPSSPSRDILTYPIENQYGLRSQNFVESRESKKAGGDNGIQKGTRVEVFKDGAWFSADVMSLENGKAYVHHTDLLSAEGSGRLKEWVEIEGIEDKAPKIRIPHPMTAVQFDGSRKRLRAAIGSFTCSVGDKVDVWIRNRWWEGVVSSKSERDGTSITVHLPAIGETSVVKTWQLRPSLVWKDGEWIEWSNKEDDRCHQMGDTPKGKRAKVGSSGKRAKAMDKATKTVEISDPGKPEGSNILPLSAKEKVFDIGKSSTELGKPDSRRIVRSGLRKHSQGVIFGVPKPGKRRKFMEVSKQHVVDQSNKRAQVNNLVKKPNYMMPRGIGSHGLRNQKEDKISELKIKAPAAVESRGVSGRMAAKNGSKFLVSAFGDASVTDRPEKMKDSLGHVVKHNVVGNGSSASREVAIGGAISFSSGVPSDATVSRISAPKSDSVCKEKSASTCGNLVKLEEDELLNSISQVEPRRSNRQIQPTSRLLEGLQTSAFNLKVPFSLLDKGPRSARNGAKERSMCYLMMAGLLEVLHRSLGIKGTTRMVPLLPSAASSAKASPAPAPAPAPPSLTLPMSHRSHASPSPALAAHSPQSSSDLCAMARCPLESIDLSECASFCPPFYYAYGDGIIIAHLYRHSVAIPMSSPSLVLLGPSQLHVRLRPLSPRRASQRGRLRPRNPLHAGATVQAITQAGQPVLILPGLHSFDSD
ncbi:hypothetical protein SAY86_021238 [Trapa natans]|uniref:Agenet domain-containing protein n=1 Tax=Trapa natans TaxID=22666 RepID=A0AAN7MTT6_TRANT|nr:hypothetical protein SAY86_021238 [Trapa natans]